MTYYDYDPYGNNKHQVTNDLEYDPFRALMSFKYSIDYGIAPTELRQENVHHVFCYICCVFKREGA